MFTTTVMYVMDFYQSLCGSMSPHPGFSGLLVVCGGPLDLRRMYHLFSRVPATLEELRHAMSEYVKTTGRELVADQERVKVRTRAQSHAASVLRLGHGTIHKRGRQRSSGALYRLHC